MLICNVDLASLSDKKFLYDFAKETYSDKNITSNESTRDRSLIKVPKSPAIMAYEISTIFLPSDLNELCDGLKRLLQEIQAGKISDIINEESIALVDKSLEYKCISTKQHKQLLFKCSLLHTNYKQVWIRIITHIYVCVHKYKYSYKCMFTQI